MLNTRSGLAYGALGAGILSFLPGVGELGAVLVFAAILLGWRDLRLVSRMLLGLVLLTLGLAAAAEPSALPAAAASMTRLTALILTVMLLSSMLGKSADLGLSPANCLQGRQWCVTTALPLAPVSCPCP